jgi:choline-sulfatase
MKARFNKKDVKKPEGIGNDNLLKNHRDADFGQIGEAGSGMSRRDFIKSSGATLLAGIVGSSMLPLLQRKALAAEFPNQPNIVLILTDQERFPRHWPDGWADANLPHRKRLADTGITFTQAVCNSCMCSPSRATLFTGLYPQRTGVEDTLTEDGRYSDTEQALSLQTQNMAKLLKSAGYNVIYKGKWHLSKPANGSELSTEDVSAYGFDGWDPPDAGEATEVEGFGGGEQHQNDPRFVDDAVRFLTEEADASKPFALIVSLVNPHDVLAYPSLYEGEYDPADFSQGIDLPPTIDEDLSSKPACQQDSLSRIALALKPLNTEEKQRNYVNFYAYLHKVVDREIGRIIDAIEAPRGANGTEPSLRESTIIIRTADHGEMGLSHGGLRQKMFNVYEESINVPLVFSNPILFPRPVVTNSLAALVDLMPTIASLAKVDKNEWEFQGMDLTPILSDPNVSVQDAVHFVYDDQKAGMGSVENAVPQPNHIRCIREKEWKYAIYFDPDGVEVNQFEMYDLKNDPNEVTNLANSQFPEHIEKKAELEQKLFAMMNRLGTMPPVLSQVDEVQQWGPSQVRLDQNYPNPFNGETTIHFQLEHATQVKLTVCNIRGQQVARLADGSFLSGGHSIKFNAAHLPSGEYFARLKMGGFVKTIRMILQK